MMLTFVEKRKMGPFVLHMIFSVEFCSGRLRWSVDFKMGSLIWVLYLETRNFYPPFRPPRRRCFVFDRLQADQTRRPLRRRDGVKRLGRLCLRPFVHAERRPDHWTAHPVLRIDGIGVLRVNLVSFHVLFQAKRWKGSVGAGVVRDFRGAMVGRADKGLVITTASFTAEARKEATRDGAPAIDLVDGEALCALLKDLKLGVKVRLVEEVEVDPAFFAGL